MSTTTQPKEPAVPRVTLPVDLRDYFAAKALPSVMADWKETMDAHGSDFEIDVPSMAQDAYIMADAMLKARHK